jgi:hypothetical protein
MHVYRGAAEEGPEKSSTELEGTWNAIAGRPAGVIE